MTNIQRTDARLVSREGEMAPAFNPLDPPEMEPDHREKLFKPSNPLDVALMSERHIQEARAEAEARALRHAAAAASLPPQGDPTAPECPVCKHKHHNHIKCSVCGHLGKGNAWRLPKFLGAARELNFRIFAAADKPNDWCVRTLPPPPLPHIAGPRARPALARLTPPAPAPSPASSGASFSARRGTKSPRSASTTPSTPRPGTCWGS